MVGRREGEGETTAFGYGWYSLFVGVAKPKPEAEPGRAGTAYIKLGHAALSLLGTTIAYDLTYLVSRPGHEHGCIVLDGR